MKSKLIIFPVVLAMVACKTTSVPATAGNHAKHREAPEPQYAEFAQPTPGRDTLYLLAGDPMTKLTLNIWDADTTFKQKPVIRLICDKEMLCVKNRCNDKVNQQK
jgi:hypothetical protein